MPHLGITDDRKMAAVVAPAPNAAPLGKHNIIMGPDKWGNNANDANKRVRIENKKADPRDDRDLENSLGFLTWTGTGTPPKFCPVFVKTISMKTKERICLWHCIQGYFCGRGKDSCRQGHIKSFGTLCNEEQKKSEKFVKDTPGIEFVSGQGPKGMV